MSEPLEFPDPDYREKLVQDLSRAAIVELRAAIHSLGIHSLTSADASLSQAQTFLKMCQEIRGRKA